MVANPTLIQMELEEHVPQGSRALQVTTASSSHWVTPVKSTTAAPREVETSLGHSVNLVDDKHPPMLLSGFFSTIL